MRETAYASRNEVIHGTNDMVRVPLESRCTSLGVQPPAAVMTAADAEISDVNGCVVN